MPFQAILIHLGFFNETLLRLVVGISCAFQQLPDQDLELASLQGRMMAFAYVHVFIPTSTCMLFFQSECIQTDISVRLDLFRPRRFFSSEAVCTIWWSKRLWCNYKHSHTTPKNKTTFGFFRPFCGFFRPFCGFFCPNRLLVKSQILRAWCTKKKQYNAAILVETKFFVRKGFFRP